MDKMPKDIIEAGEAPPGVCLTCWSNGELSARGLKEPIPYRCLENRHLWKERLLVEPKELDFRAAFTGFMVLVAPA